MIKVSKQERKVKLPSAEDQQGGIIERCFLFAVPKMYSVTT